ncbi:putative endonuclease containing a URI domain [Halobacteroides halobius DSM 5150]|uniref:Putative endonuclease containing a URI domain n=1 Tax=Halobacteroides halobius (strain ATCC 35273 / DSM 5150 / MD-1) TaxID=748449 RepID=L0K4Y7_HALHC|nr:GIY-YIG nuclease family protein [Halobacteroides halobius]AGB40086.1 putative endonuclease containing a URI domain [Halobacteroides halobius DSM 5150]
MAHYIYILECADNTLYTGYTTNVKRRLKEHNKGQGAKYTRGRTPVKLCYTEEYLTRSEAQKREYAIKQLKRQEKLDLIKEDGND